jgi:hypothetical protein
MKGARLICLIVGMLVLTGCEDGDSAMPLPRLTCTQVTALYSCGRGGTCEQCGNWALGCPKPLFLIQTPAEKGEPRLACRLKEIGYGLHDTEAAEVAPPLR